MGSKTATSKAKRSFWHRHSLGLVCSAILLLWIVLYSFGSPETHWGSFFGNAIADWTGLVVTIYATKHLYEKGSAESRRPAPKRLTPLWLWVREHSLTVFLVLTGIVWIVVFARSNSESKWGQVVGNIVSEWTQLMGVVLLTKRLLEWHSKESNDQS